ncbi:hypothetical protein [Pseudomonas sp. JL3]|uniref:hypothetical protein n=1 Tax=Pseudomonas sp. JL3 TaxID=2919943 RepID=UPI002862A8DD|nr:hypothetical protein [Pseudomonas sp. JL3]MDR8368064.1 hypothetical protein [Pseudomonas sp. JL3]
MKVVCKTNNLHDILDPYTSARLKHYISRSDGEIDLEIAREYTVYGVEFWDNCPWFYLCTEEDDEYPKPFAAEFFEVIDEHISQYWKLSSVPSEDRENSTSLVFDEWSKDPSFYERLIDGDPNAVLLFSKYRDLMNSE